MFNARGYYTRKHLHKNNLGNDNTFYPAKKWKRRHHQLKKAQIRKYATAQFNFKNYYEMKVFHLLSAFFDLRVSRQFIIDAKYITDLYIPEKRLVIEIDGEYHNTIEQKQKDEERTRYLRNKGYKVIRFTHQEIKTDMIDILNRLQEIIIEPKEDLDKEYQTMVSLPNS